MPFPKWVMVGNGIPYTAFQVAALSSSITLFNLAAGAELDAIKMKQRTAFAGAGLAVITAEIGVAGDTASIAQAFDVKQAVGADVFQRSQNIADPTDGAATPIVVTLRANANLSNLTAGVLDVWARLSSPIT